MEIHSTPWMLAKGKTGTVVTSRSVGFNGQRKAGPAREHTGCARDDALKVCRILVCWRDTCFLLVRGLRGGLTALLHAK